MLWVSLLSKKLSSFLVSGEVAPGSGVPGASASGGSAFPPAAYLRLCLTFRSDL